MNCFKTKHKIDGKVWACTGDGFISGKWITEHYQPPTELTRLESELLGAFGIDKENVQGEDIFHRPTSPFRVCPCKTKELSDKLDIEGEHRADEHFGKWMGYNLEPKQVKIFDDYIRNGNLFLHGETGKGKSVLAHFIARKPISRDAEIYVAAEFRKHLQSVELGKIEWTPEGKLIIIDDADKEKKGSEFYERELWHLIDLVDKGKSNIIITSNLNLDDFCEKFSDSKTSKSTMQRRIETACVVAEIK